MEHPEVQQAVVRLESPTEPVTIVTIHRTIEMYSLTEHELEMIRSGNSPVHLAFFTMSIGVAVSFFTALMTATLDTNWFAAFVAVLVVSTVGSLYFGARAWLDWRATTRQIRRITERRGSPI